MGFLVMQRGATTTFHREVLHVQSSDKPHPSTSLRQARVWAGEPSARSRKLRQASDEPKEALAGHITHNNDKDKAQI